MCISSWNLNKLYNLINNRRGSHCGPMRLYNIHWRQKVVSIWIRAQLIMYIGSCGGERWRRGKGCDGFEAPGVRGESLKMIELWLFNESFIPLADGLIYRYNIPIIHTFTYPSRRPSWRSGWNDYVILNITVDNIYKYMKPYLVEGARAD